MRAWWRFASLAWSACWLASEALIDVREEWLATDTSVAAKPALPPVAAGCTGGPDLHASRCCIRSRAAERALNAIEARAQVAGLTFQRKILAASGRGAEECFEAESCGRRRVGRARFAETRESTASHAFRTIDAVTPEEPTLLSRFACLSVRFRRPTGAALTVVRLRAVPRNARLPERRGTPTYTDSVTVQTCLALVDRCARFTLLLPLVNDLASPVDTVGMTTALTVIAGLSQSYGEGVATRGDEARLQGNRLTCFSLQLCQTTLGGHRIVEDVSAASNCASSGASAVALGEIAVPEGGVAGRSRSEALTRSGHQNVQEISTEGIHLRSIHPDGSVSTHERIDVGLAAAEHTGQDEENPPANSRCVHHQLIVELAWLQQMRWTLRKGDRPRWTGQKRPTVDGSKPANGACVETGFH